MSPERVRDDIAGGLYRAMEASKPSIERNTAWRPSLAPDGDTFRMVDLLFRAFPHETLRHWHGRLV